MYKIARKEKIELAQPFNALATNWTPNDLNNALDDIKNGLAVQKAAAKFGIPSGTLYGRCKKVGIELSKSSKLVIRVYQNCLLVKTTIQKAKINCRDGTFEFQLADVAVQLINTLKPKNNIKYIFF